MARKASKKKVTKKKKVAKAKKVDPAQAEKVRDAVALLQETKSKKRESGAKRLRKLADPSAGPELLKALSNEVLDARTYATQYHMILALGFCGGPEALPVLWDLADREQRATLLYMALGDAIVRLTAAEGTKTVFEVIKTENFMLIYGAFRAMALLRLTPTARQIGRIIAVAADPRAAKEVAGYPGDTTGVRKWVAVAATNWPRTKKLRDFLEDCVQTRDSSLRLAAEAALAGEHKTWNPY